MRIAHYMQDIDFTRGGPPRAVIDQVATMHARGHQAGLLTTNVRDVPASWLNGTPDKPEVVQLPAVRGSFGRHLFRRDRGGSGSGRAVRHSSYAWRLGAGESTSGCGVPASEHPVRRESSRHARRLVHGPEQFAEANLPRNRWPSVS